MFHRFPTLIYKKTKNKTLTFSDSPLSSTWMVSMQSLKFFFIYPGFCHAQDYKTYTMQQHALKAVSSKTIAKKLYSKNADCIIIAHFIIKFVSQRIL